MQALATTHDIEALVRDKFEPLILNELQRVVAIGETARLTAIRDALSLPPNDNTTRSDAADTGQITASKPHPLRTYWQQFTAEERSAMMRERRAKGMQKGDSSQILGVSEEKPDPRELHSPFNPVSSDNRLIRPAGGIASVVMHGECREVLRRIPRSHVDLIVTSPPYPEHGLEYERPADSSVHAWVELMGDFLAEARDVLKPGGNLWINVGFERVRDERGRDTRQRVPLTYRMGPLIEAAGLEMMNEIIWLKPQHQNAARHRLSTKSERWLWLFKPGAKPHFDIEAVRIEPKVKDRRNNPRGSNPADVWTFAGVNGNDRRRTAHPCQFPEEMIERIVKGWSKPGDLVLDPFAGSGTVGAVSQRLGRRSLLVEREAKYVEIARQRLAA